jgi:hypothetical protein
MKMKKNLIILLLIISSSQIVLAQKKYSMGLFYDKEKYNSAPKKPNLIKKGDLPSNVNYEKYTPTIGNQGQLGTCVGFATAYYFRTIMEAKQKIITDKTKINNIIFSPGYLYNNIEPKNMKCEGASLTDAFDFLIKQGCVPLTKMPYPSCGKDASFEAETNSRIGSYSVILQYEDNAESKIQKAKEALSDGFPFVIALLCPSSFSNIDEVWEPAPSDYKFKPTDIQLNNVGAHALTVVGYDDNKYGGAFRIVNSWTSDWADNGFCWMRYKDFAHFTMLAIEGYPLPEPKPAPTEITLAGSAKFQLLDKTSVTVVRTTIQKGGDVNTDDNVPDKMVAYSLKEAQKSGTKFKFLVSINKQGYVYSIGSDLTNRSSKFFPVNDKTNPAFAANTEIMLPAENMNITLDNVIGTDYWLFLFSEKPLDIDDYKRKIDEGAGSFADRVMAAFGSELVDPSNINYVSDKVGFELSGNPKGSIVPLMLSLKHQ